MQGRNEGIAFCDKIAKEKGLEELQRVTRQRNLAGLRTLIDPRELDQDLYKEGKKEYLVKCEMTEETEETVKTCKTREEAENILEQILNQYDRGQRVIKIK